jgi:hypothetical protein
MKYEIGDSFVIINTDCSLNWKYKCKDQKEFIIKSFSKSLLSVYYEDNRTNPKCRCNNCSMNKGVKCIGVSNIELVSKRIQIERENKLKRLGI